MAVPSLSNIITDIENAIQTTEADVYAWIVQIKSGIAVLEADLAAGLKWIASVAPSIVSDLGAGLAIAQAIPGLTIPVTVIEATTAAAAALTAVAASENAGQSSAQTLVAAYGAVVNANAAKAGVQAAVTTAPTPAAN